MKKHIFCLILILPILGCATNKQVAKPAAPVATLVKTEVKEKTNQKVENKVETSQEPIVEQEDPILEEIELVGVIFAKTLFEGVLEVPFVNFTIQKVDDNREFELSIGDKGEAVGFFWEGKKIKPGYFFKELPEGSYVITKVAIPVGNSIAEEEIHISFKVHPEDYTYLGTLKIIGTKEKIKLGGVPVIKPGFEYQAQILDNREEGKILFEEIYPNNEKEIIVDIMTLKPLN